MSDDITFRVERRDNPAGFPVAYLINVAGVIRRASEEEAALWDALQAAREHLAQSVEMKQRRGR